MGRTDVPEMALGERPWVPGCGEGPARWHMDVTVTPRRV